MSLEVDIRKDFKGFRLHVQFHSDGQPLGILGASGSGKSMTLKCIAGILTPDSGHVVLNGRVLFDSKRKINLKPQKRNIGYLFQSYALFPNMTVEQNIACSLQGSRQEKGPKIRELIRRYKLTDLEKRYPAQLSGGQQQRVALARILAYEPEALLLDEPFSALDAYLKEALQVEMRNLLQHYPGHAVMVTHNRDEVYKLSNHLLVLDEGKKVSFGSTKSVFSRPDHLITARLTGCKNFSRAKQTGENEVEALDWQTTLRVEGPIPPRLTHIGVRAHYFYPSEQNAPNAIRFLPLEKVESPFEWNVLFRNADAAEDGGTIWWKYAKELENASSPKYLAVQPRDVLLLENT
ncbi:ATP-binding cassette domain-containing protein [Ruminococcaceae bacterium OttesenSCG-928-I18]|nr:ATP-binding cassette domain-containing protein [Ruminococcaceae bacterium OttesenSCG-928-I18]